MTLAILGGTGFLGRAVAERAVLRGLTPLVLARGEHPVDLPEGARFVAVDRMDGAALKTILAAHGVTTLIDIFALGLLNTRAVFEAVPDGARYLLLSSVDVYANYGGLLKRETPPVQAAPARENDPLRSFRYPYRGNPHRPQGVSQALFEDYDKILLEEATVAETRFATTVIRAPMIFGPGDKQNRFGWAIDAVRQASQHGGEIAVDARAAQWPNSYGYVENVAEAMLVAALDPRAAGRTYNVGQELVRTPVEWLQRFGEIMGQQVNVRAVPPELKGLQYERAEASDLRYPLTLDTSRIRDELFFVDPVDEETALRATIAAAG